MLNNVDVYKALFAISGMIVAVSWRTFLSGDTFSAVKDGLNALKVETKKGSKWDVVGNFLDRDNNRAIMRLCLLQMQLLVSYWWICFFLALACVGWVAYIAFAPNIIIGAIVTHVSGGGIDFVIALPLITLLLFIIGGFFIHGYKRRLVDLTRQMRSYKER